MRPLMAHITIVLAVRESNSPSKGAAKVLLTGTLLTICIFINLGKGMIPRSALSRRLGFFPRETTYSHGKYLFSSNSLICTAATAPLLLEIEELSLQTR